MICVEFRVSDFEFLVYLGVEEDIHVGRDPPEAIGQKEDADDNQKDPADHRDGLHIESDLLERGQEHIEGQGGEEKGNSQPQRIDG